MLYTYYLFILSSLSQLKCKQSIYSNLRSFFQQPTSKYENESLQKNFSMSKEQKQIHFEIKDHHLHKEKSQWHQKQQIIAELTEELAFSSLEQLQKFMEKKYEHFVQQYQKHTLKINQIIVKMFNNIRDEWISKQKRELFKYLGSLSIQMSQKQCNKVLGGEKSMHDFDNGVKIELIDNIPYFKVHNLQNGGGGKQVLNRYFCAGEAIKRLYVHIQNKRFKKQMVILCEYFSSIKQEVRKVTGIEEEKEQKLQERERQEKFISEWQKNDD